MKGTIILLIISLLTLSSFSLVFAEDSSSGRPSKCDKVGDALWVRPLGIIGTGLGALAYVVSYPVTKPLKQTDEAKEFLIGYPYRYYFKRPLGEF